jgi:hypothetical protein
MAAASNLCCQRCLSSAVSGLIWHLFSFFPSFLSSHNGFNHAVLRCAVLLQMPYDLFNYLLRQRIIFLAGYVNDKV